MSNSLEDTVKFLRQTAETKQLIYSIPASLTADTILPPPDVVFVQSRVPIVCNLALEALSRDDDALNDLRAVFFPAFVGYPVLETVADWQQKVATATSNPLNNKFIRLEFADIFHPNKVFSPYEAVLSNRPVLCDGTPHAVAAWVDSATEQYCTPTIFWSTDTPHSQHAIYTDLFQRLDQSSTEAERVILVESIQTVDAAVLGTFFHQLSHVFVRRDTIAPEKIFASSKTEVGVDGGSLVEEVVWGGATHLSLTTAGSYIMVAVAAFERDQALFAMNKKGLAVVHAFLSAGRPFDLPIFNSTTSDRVTCIPPSAAPSSFSTIGGNVSGRLTPIPQTPPQTFLTTKADDPNTYDDESTSSLTTICTPAFVSPPLYLSSSHIWSLQRAESLPEVSLVNHDWDNYVFPAGEVWGMRDKFYLLPVRGGDEAEIPTASFEQLGRARL